MNERDRAPVAPRTPRVSARTCVGCGKPDAPDDLVRVVLGPRDPSNPESGAPVAVDLDGGGTHGRGAHVHAAPACLQKAAKSGLSRSFKTKVATTDAELAAQIAAACDRRIVGLLTGAFRARMVAVGADAALEALAKSEQKGGTAFVVVACDAASVVEKRAIAAAIAEGRAVAWREKATLGPIFGRDEVAVCVVSNEAVAQQIGRARRMADSVSKGPGPHGAEPTGGGQRSETRGEACRSREVR